MDGKGELDSIGPDGLVPDDERPHRPRRSAWRWFLVLLGAVFLFLAFSRSFHAWVDRQLGLSRVFALGMAVLFFYVAFLGFDIGRLRERLLDLAEQILRVFYGPNFRRERQAVDILVRALRSDDPGVRATSLSHLKRLTGQDLGDNAEAWDEWWQAHRATFRAATTETPPHDRS